MLVKELLLTLCRTGPGCRQHVSRASALADPTEVYHSPSRMFEEDFRFWQILLQKLIDNQGRAKYLLQDQ